MGKKIFLTCCVIGFTLSSIISIISNIIHKFAGKPFFLMIFSAGGIVATGISLVVYCTIEVIELIWEDR